MPLAPAAGYPQPERHEPHNTFVARAKIKNRSLTLFFERTPACRDRVWTFVAWGEAEMQQIAAWIGEVLAVPTEETRQERVRGKVQELTAHFPAPAPSF